MIPAEDSSVIPRQVQPPATLDQREFYAARRNFRQNVDRWARARGLGKASKLLLEIASRSTPRDPWSWAVAGTQRQWAEAWGISPRTLERWLSELRSKGLLEVEVRSAPALRGKANAGYEFPVFSIHPDVVEEVSRLLDPTFWPSSCNRHFGGYSEGPQGVDESVDNLDTPVAARVEDDGVTEVTSPSNNSNRTKEEIPVYGVDRRPRRRRTRVRRYEDDYDPPVIGLDPDRPRKEAKQASPTVAAEREFVAAWKAMLARTPSLSMRLDMNPWPKGQVVAFRHWLKQELLPAVEGDLVRARKVFDAFCADLSSGQRFVAQDVPAFRVLHRSLDRYVRMVPATSDARELEDARESRAERFRLARGREVVRRPGPRVSSEYFEE